ncbi:MAG: hypothetical protein AAB785_01985, partial [Patescibacteria group bacterium]
MMAEKKCEDECIDNVMACEKEKQKRYVECNKSPESPLSWLTNFTSALFSWDSTSWEGMKQYA